MCRLDAADGLELVCGIELSARPAAFRNRFVIRLSHILDNWRKLKATIGTPRTWAISCGTR
jgi:hypothetical protein